MSMHTGRRNFLKTAGIAAGAGAVLGGATGTPDAQAKSRKKFELGLASYTLRKFDLDQTIAMTQRMGLKKIAFKSFHLPMDASKSLIRETAAKVRNAGLDLYGCGVVYMRKEAEVHQAFEYAQEAGMRLIIGVPAHEYLDLVEKKVQEYDIPVAIHNHGPGDKLYASPGDVYRHVKDRDKRLGLCIDIGHVKRINEDPASAIEQYADRLLDMHIKDVSVAAKEGKSVEAGRGVIDIPGVMRALIHIGYSGVAALEFEKDAEDPLAGAAESIGYFNGVLDMLYEYIHMDKCENLWGSDRVVHFFWTTRIFLMNKFV